MYKNLDRVHLHSNSVEWKALLNHVADMKMKKDMPCSSSVNHNCGCPTDTIYVAVSATAVASKVPISTGVTGMLPVADVSRENLGGGICPGW